MHMRLESELEKKINLDEYYQNSETKYWHETDEMKVKFKDLK